MPTERGKVIDQFRKWYEQHGACVWSVEQVEEATGVPACRLWNNDDFAGILAKLCDDGVLSRFGDHFAIMPPRWGDE